MTSKYDQHQHTMPSGFSGAFGIPQPPPDAPCDLCEAQPGIPHRCFMDGASHGHGMIHVPADGRRGGLKWVCCDCLNGLLTAG